MFQVPDEFYQLVLGPRLKYSSGYWPSPDTTIEQSEIAMLEMYCERAGLKDGMTVIDLVSSRIERCAMIIAVYVHSLEFDP